MSAHLGWVAGVALRTFPLYLGEYEPSWKEATQASPSKNREYKPGVVAPAFNSSTWEAGAGESLSSMSGWSPGQVSSQPWATERNLVL